MVTHSYPLTNLRHLIRQEIQAVGDVTNLRHVISPESGILLAF